MVAAFSHELRTPLNGLITFIKSAINKCKCKSCEEFLKPSEDLCQYLLNIVNDILTFTQMSFDKKIAMNFEEVDILKVIEDSMKIFKI